MTQGVELLLGLRVVRVKGQVVGPITFGLTVVDQDRKSILYNDVLSDAIVKHMAMNARWQIRQLQAVQSQVIMFVDEPYMASFGSAFINLSREQAVSIMNEVFDAIHDEGAISGVHCCANTDWSLLLDTRVNILNLDAYGFIENLALYPAELRAFLDRGGAVAWGIVPNNEAIYNETPESIVERLWKGIQVICDKAQARGVDISPEMFASRSMIVPACGLGSTSIEVAERVLDMMPLVGELLRG